MKYIIENTITKEFYNGFKISVGSSRLPTFCCWKIDAKKFNTKKKAEKEIQKIVALDKMYDSELTIIEYNGGDKIE